MKGTIHWDHLLYTQRFKFVIEFAIANKRIKSIKIMKKSIAYQAAAVFQSISVSTVPDLLLSLQHKYYYTTFWKRTLFRREYYVAAHVWRFCTAVSTHSKYSSTVMYAAWCTAYIVSFAPAYYILRQRESGCISLRCNGAQCSGSSSCGGGGGGGSGIQRVSRLCAYRLMFTWVFMYNKNP